MTYIVPLLCCVSLSIWWSLQRQPYQDIEEVWRLLARYDDHHLPMTAIRAAELLSWSTFRTRRCLEFMVARKMVIVTYRLDIAPLGGFSDLRGTAVCVRVRSYRVDPDYKRPIAQPMAYRSLSPAT